MSIKLRQIGPCLAAEVEGIDFREPLSAGEVTASHDGMDEYAALIFHRVYIDGEEHLAFARSLSELEHAA